MNQQDKKKDIVKLILKGIEEIFIENWYTSKEKRKKSLFDALK